MLPVNTESVNFDGAISFAGSQALTTRERKQARKNLGMNKDILVSSIMDLVNVRAEEIYYSNYPIEENSLRFSFYDLDYDPNEAGIAPGGVWTKRSTLYTNIWDWTRNDTDWSYENSFGNKTNETGIGLVQKTKVYSLNDAYKFEFILSPNQILRFDEPCKIINSETSNVTSFLGSFQYAVGIYEIWKPFDYTSATTVERMFFGCLGLYKIPNRFYIPIATSAANFMRGCGSIKSIENIYAPNVTDLKYAFMQMYNLTAAYNLQFPSAVDFRDLFECDFRLEIVENLGDTSTVETWHDCFGGCISLVKVPETLDCSSGVDCQGIFSYCMALEKVPNLIFGNNVTTFDGLFTCCSKLTEIPDNPAYHYVQNMKKFMSADDTFFNVAPYTNPPIPMNIKELPSWLPQEATNVDTMFYGCKNVEDGISRWYLVLSEKSTPVTSHVDTFKDCGVNTEEGRNQLEMVPDDWK